MMEISEYFVCYTFKKSFRNSIRYDPLISNCIFYIKVLFIHNVS